MVSILPYDAFLRIVKQNLSIDHVFLLGAGASKSSGIPTAMDCIWEWKLEIYKSINRNAVDGFDDMDSDSKKLTIQDWLDNQGHYLPINHPDEYLTYVEVAFQTEESRKQYFKRICKGKTPSIGYNILCLMAETGMVRLVFTTNFDRLIIKATEQTKITPIEVSLDTNYRIYQPSSREELLCVELHGDYKYGPLKNTRKELDTQQDEFKKILAHHLKDKHLIVLGYSGRDKSLMDSLKKAYEEKGGGILYWCGYKDDRSIEVDKLLDSITENDRKGYYIPAENFDDTLIDMASYCFEDNENFQQLIKQSRIISDNLKLSSIAEEIKLSKQKTPLYLNKLEGEE